MLIASRCHIQTYLVDASTLRAAPALAANKVSRSLMGALLLLAGREGTIALSWDGKISILHPSLLEDVQKSPEYQVKL